jgi:hypothetical protein
MYLNPISNCLELNGQEVHLLRKLDEVIERDGIATLDINETEVTFLKKSGKVFGVCVEKGMTAVNFTGTGAFLDLAKKLAGVN